MLGACRGEVCAGARLHQLALIRGGNATGNDPRLLAQAGLVRADAALAYARLVVPSWPGVSWLGRLIAGRRGRDDQAVMDEARAAAAIQLGDLDAAEPFAASALRLRADSGYEREAALTAITFVTIHVQAGEPDGSTLTDRNLGAVAGCARSRGRLGPLGEALTARGGSTNLDLAQRSATVRRRA